MKICLLRSGSSGNCIFLQHRHTRILLDAGGMSRKRLLQVIGEIGISPDSLSAVVATHLHSDHLNRSTLLFCRQFSIPLYLHRDNLGAFQTLYDRKCREGLALTPFSFESPFDIGTLRVRPFPISHDAAGVTSGFRLHPADTDSPAIGYAADLGHAPEPVIEALKDSEILCLEANHDLDLLWKNPRRTFLHKKRVAGDRGHLSNNQTAQALLRLLEISRIPPRTVVLCHLSADHNSPQLALQQVGALLREKNAALTLVAASRHERTGFFYAGEEGEEGGSGTEETGSPVQLSLF